MLPMVQWALLAVFGAILFVRANYFSVGYNAWTSSIRQRNPPTPEMLKVNTNIMKWLFRVMGAFFFLLSCMAIMGIWDGK